MQSTNSKTNFKIVSETGDGMGFAARLVQEGHNVQMWIRNAEARSVGDNIIPKTGDFEDLLLAADRSESVFVFDSSGNGVLADYVKQQGFAVLGGSILADRLERDRTFGTSVMQQADIKIPETKSFTDFETAKKFVEDRPEVRWVYKPSKQLGDLSPSHVSYDTEDLVEMLDNIAKEIDIADIQFELQSFEKGVAFSTELWFQDGDFIPPLTNHTLERKELMNEDIGPSGGCLGNLTWFCQGCAACKMAMNLIPWARSVRYHGNIDLNVIASSNGLWGLEFTPRFGYDATPTLLWELVKGSLGTFFADAARGRMRSLDLRDDFAGALRVTIPPWPTERHTAEENVPIRGINDKTLERNTYFYNIKKDEFGELCTAGAWGIVCLFTAHSSSPVCCFQSPLEACRSLRLKNKQFRTDLAKRFMEDIENLENAGIEINVGVKELV